MTAPEIRTARLWLRPWRDDDLDGLAALNADAEVMAHFPSRLDRAQSAAMATRIRAHFEEHGFGLWSIEVPGVAPFAGLVGLMRPRFETSFTPCVEIGWRLARDHWGHGYATEGAAAALAFGFDRLGLDEIVSFTVPANTRSRRVMEAIGMRPDPGGDFDHPLLPVDSPLSRHVLYRRSRADLLTDVRH
jgi:RimJ/RimL family protein N-acetyltransferase